MKAPWLSDSERNRAKLRRRSNSWLFDLRRRCARFAAPEARAAPRPNRAGTRAFPRRVGKGSQSDGARFFPRAARGMRAGKRSTGDRGVLGAKSRVAPAE